MNGVELGWSWAGYPASQMPGVRACSQQVGGTGASSPNPAASAAQCWSWVQTGKEGACSPGSFDRPRPEWLRPYRCPLWGPADGGETMPEGMVPARGRAYSQCRINSSLGHRVGLWVSEPSQAGLAMSLLSEPPRVCKVGVAIYTRESVSCDNKWMSPGTYTLGV